ncbi:MAG: GTPase domain-containing protein [Candidatus Electryoneaceae bacterium]|nr:GTPase domain-containing protein [Candidatus Electryoneaceae bacterium]
MPHINYHDQEMTFKIVYYGPGMSGKTTNLVEVYKRLTDDVRGDLLTLNTAQDRTLFFDFFPIELGDIGGYVLRFNMYTVPGQIYYEASRRLILDGADGVIFIADSQPHMVEENITSFQMMCQNLASYNIDWREFPIVFQYNKRDCENPIPLGTFEKTLNLDNIQITQAIAPEGKGVMETIRILAKNVISQFQI